MLNLAESAQADKYENSDPAQIIGNLPTFHPSLETVQQRKDLTRVAKDVYAYLLYLWLINRATAFRVKNKKIAEKVGCSLKTVPKALWQLRGRPAKTGENGRPAEVGELEFDPLIAVVATGRSSYFHVLPLENLSVDNSEPKPPKGGFRNRQKGVSTLESPFLDSSTLGTYIGPEPPVCVEKKKKREPLTETQEQGKALLKDSPLLARLQTPIRDAGVGYTLKGKPLRILYQRAGEHGLEYVQQLIDLAERETTDEHTTGAILYSRLKTDFQPETEKPANPDSWAEQRENLTWEQELEIETAARDRQLAAEQVQEPPQDVRAPIDYSVPLQTTRTQQEPSETVNWSPAVMERIRKSMAR